MSFSVVEVDTSLHIAVAHASKYETPATGAGVCKLGKVKLGSRPVDDVVDDAVLLRLRGCHDEVALHVAFDAVQ